MVTVEDCCGKDWTRAAIVYEGGYVQGSRLGVMVLMVEDEVSRIGCLLLCSIVVGAYRWNACQQC